ncbi:MAG: GNAT family N-acetyltransferase [Chloroflexi bacterium]|nr:GNAT family N-acetyltransferase [Chloroflexota bacterium]
MRLIADATQARVYLRQDRPLWAWPLCTLGPREWPYVRLWVQGCEPPLRDRPADERPGSPLGGGAAGLWTLDHPAWGGGLQAFGETAALERMLQSAVLPGRAFVRTLPTAVELVTARFAFEWLDAIVRMQVTPDTLCVPPEADLVESLTLDDAGALVALYAHWPESRFLPSRLRQGYQYVGVRDGSRLVAVAEHTLAAPDDGLAVVQGVLVEPAWRGRGLAGAVTAALTARLFAQGFAVVVLDVRESNVAAQAAYRRIGYREHVTLLAGPATAR